MTKSKILTNNKKKQIMNKQLKKLFAINITSEDPHAPFVWPESFRPAAKWKGTDCDLYLFYWFPVSFIFLINVSNIISL